MCSSCIDLNIIGGKQVRGISIDWRLVLAVYRFLPAPPLSAYIEAFYFSEEEVPLQARERRLPDGRVALVINLGHERLGVAPREASDQFQSFQRGVLSGAHSRFCVLDTTTMSRTVYVAFKPDGARPFLPLPATAVTNQVVDLSCIFGPAASALYEQLQAVGSNEDRVSLLQRFLLARANWEQTPHPAVTFALAAFQAGNERYSIAEVTEQLGVSSRRFIHLFEQAVGLTPKMFCRLRRFQEVLEHIEKGQPVQWADLALCCGYFDQAHFIHDFRAFAGLTPGAYLAQHGAHRNHVPLSE
jgi:AraC-like DNA-binding protein